MTTQLSPIAQSILIIIRESTKPPRGSYIAGWNICDKLGVDRGQLDCAIPGTQYNKALKELIDAGLVEELANLGCWYRLCKQQQPEQLNMLDALKDPEYDLYQECEDDKEILQGLNEYFSHYDNILTDIGQEGRS